MRKGPLVVILALLGFLAAAAGLSYWTWQELGEVEITGHGYAALALMAALTFAVGAGLMALVFFSARRGYDEEAHRQERRYLRRDEDHEDHGDRG